MPDTSNWTWEGNPKKQFERRRLERCYQLEYKDNKYKEECLSKVEVMKEPYWNFWRVVFAGWLVRYPIQILKGIGTVVVGLFLFGVLVLSSSESVDESSPMKYNDDVIQ